jgi:hypothetical protein
VKSSRQQAGRRVIGELTLTLPVARLSVEVRIGDTFTPGLDDQEAVGDAGIFRLVPLQLVVADEAVLERPVLRFRLVSAVELVRPGE